MNPFIISGFAGEKYFCDRISEMQKLKNAFENNRNVTLFSLRRMGKSSLVKFLFHKLKNRADCIYADIYSARNFSEMSAIIANAVTEYYGTSTVDYLKKIAGLIKALGATLSFDQITGKPRLNFGIGNIEQRTKDMKEILNFLEKSKRRILLVIDEFQQIRNFTEKNTEAALRTMIQSCRNTHFIFCGSNRGMMESIFSASSSPFYQSTQFMYLMEIDNKEYMKFIKDKFNLNHMQISNKQIETILNICRGHTYYVQYLCNQLYSKGFNGKDEDLLKR